MFYVCAPRYREKERYVPLQVNAEITDAAPMEELTQLLEAPGYVLDLPIRALDVSGPTYRYEAGGVRGIERLCEFWRMELVWLGTPQQCIETRNQVMDKAAQIVDELLALNWRIQFAGDTFYLAEDQRVDEDTEIPEQPKLELQFYLRTRAKEP
ncbi:MAG: Type-2 serine--tRNA ligase [Candidatus Bathyarchaeota archaeon BA1]|nr:MAG: Type-2 serine--tRNA ligase [Candidatus Bathyarchaeota archaeon BA1]